MNRAFAVLLSVVAFAVLPLAAAAQAEVVLYLDAAKVTAEHAARKGVVEVPLPPGYQPGSLRVEPLAGSSVTSVEIVQLPPDPKVEKELALLRERKETLGDRLRALDIREEIFVSAAKSQSGKAPRKTKTNPEPLDGIRKGTAYAIAQLEEVFRLRRTTEREIRGVEARLKKLGDASPGRAGIARIHVSPAAGKVAASFIRTDLAFMPVYDLRIEGNERLRARLLPPKEQALRTAYAVPLPIARATPADTRFPLSAPVVQEQTLALVSAEYATGPLSTAAVSFRGDGVVLPSGEGACFRNGEYLGKVRFPGTDGPGVIELVCGGVAAGKSPK